MKFFWSSLFVSHFLFGWCSPALAVVGIIDYEDRFPFVVRLVVVSQSGKEWSCSGSVSRAGLVSTAAHCVWETRTGLPKSVSISFRDADGVSHTVGFKRIFVAEKYPARAALWEQKKTKEAFLQMAMQDIAFIVPDPKIEVEGFPHWASELLDIPECYVSVDEVTGNGENPARCWGKYSEAKLKRDLGDLEQLQMAVVGYGHYFCADYRTEKGCEIDDQRRYFEVQSLPFIRAGDDTIKPPQLWCTGKSDAGINVVQKGDSGGPNFVRALDGRWIFIGFTSGGNPDYNCASSLLMHLDLWRKAAQYYSSVSHGMRQINANGWEKTRCDAFSKSTLRVALHRQERHWPPCGFSIATM